MKFLESKKTITKINAILSCAIVVGIAVSFNFLSSKIYLRKDMTENRVFSVSDEARQIISELGDIVNIKAYFSKELPSYLLTRNMEVKDILSEMERLSGGKIVVTYFDPSSDKQFEKEAIGIGIPALQFNVVEKDKYQVTSGYLGIGVFYADKHETIPVVSDASSLEYDLLAAINKVTRDYEPKIGILSDKGAFSEQNGMEGIVNILKQRFSVQNIYLSSLLKIPEDVDVLFVAGAKEAFSDYEKYLIDQFLMSGGNIFLAQEGVQIDNSLYPQKLDIGISDLLSSWGIEIKNDLVLDVSSEIAVFQSNQGQFFTPYPFWVKIQKTGFNPESVVVNKLESLSLTWASSIEILKDKAPSGAEVFELVRTTQNSWVQSEQFETNPEAIEMPKSKEDLGTRVVGVMISGNFNSMFSKNNIPQKPKIEGMETVEEKFEFIENVENGRIVVVSDSEFALDANLYRFPYNQVFLLNILDALSSDERLISIRSKSVTDRPLIEISDKKKSAIKISNIFGAAAVFSVFGMIRFFRRRRRGKDKKQ